MKSNHSNIKSAAFQKSLGGRCWVCGGGGAKVISRTAFTFKKLMLFKTVWESIS
jgi:hypothetical protein